MNVEQLVRETEQLKAYVYRLDSIYERAKKDEKRPDFYNEVKPFFEKVEKQVNGWYTNAKEWVEVNQPKHFRAIQVEAVKKNLLEISVWAFYPETSYKRFKHSVRSVRYSLETLEKLLAQWTEGTIDNERE
ncbi:DUF1798 family protein [Fervidibacillus albus]|uniref:YppE family protein n=1 Tax=Fervidibacillus albus TaxID=2980026 RepID=A0A9E8RWY9_9BACI|nr:DUF1798 family protein [Fervidibacillus albus]WAA10593.1 YppE family protein [Fervidibacillus albus]